MRFKKLRLFVAVSLMIFVLVVGNIMAIGLLHNKAAEQSNALIDNKSKPSSVKEVQNNISTETTTPTSTISSGSQPSTTSNQNTPIQPSTGTVVHTTRRTRAS